MYYRIEGEDCIFWIPVKDTDTDRVRPTACFVRDLLVTQSIRKLKVSEQKILEKKENHFVTEWAVVFNITPQEAQMELRKHLASDD